MNQNSTTVCKACGTTNTGKFCPACGQVMAVKRLSLHELLHEVFHYFTHVEKGLLYTFKMLLTAPGKMQKQYIDGNRVRHQKPFSMFFICGTISALIFYWVNSALVNYFQAGDVQEANFFRQYWVLFQMCMLPLYSLITYLSFKKSGYNYGEIAVFQLYLFSVLFLLLAVVQLFKFFQPHLETRYMEFPLIVIYGLITNLKFFTHMKRVAVLLRSIVSIGLTFALAALLQDALVDLLYP